MICIQIQRYPCFFKPKLKAMEALLVGVVLALISGLAWLSYHHSKFASKVLLGMIIVLASATKF